MLIVHDGNGAHGVIDRCYKDKIGLEACVSDCLGNDSRDGGDGFCFVREGGFILSGGKKPPFCTGDRVRLFFFFLFCSRFGCGGGTWGAG